MTVVACFWRGKVLWGIAEEGRIWTREKVFRRNLPEILLRWEVPHAAPPGEGPKIAALQEILAELPPPPSEELWDLLEGERLPLRDFLDLADDPLAQAALLMLIEHHRAFGVDRKGEVYVKTRDEVAREEEQERARQKREKTLQHLQDWLRDPSDASLPPPSYLEALKHYALHEEIPPELESLTLPPADRLLERLESLGLLPMHINEIPYRLHVVKAFRDDPDYPLPSKPFFDDVLTEYREDAVAVDAAETVEVDDAFAFSQEGDRWRFSLYIAAPAAWIPPDHPLVELAERRMLTLYFPEETWFLFPDAWIHKRFTLTVEEPRPAMILDMEGEGTSLQTFQFRWGWVRLKDRWIPDTLRSYLEGGGTFLWEITRAWRREREHRGAFSLLLPDVKVRVEGESISIHREIPHQGHEAVMEWMIRINHLAAVEGLRRGLPLAYRASDPPPQRPTPEALQDPLLPTYVGNFFASAFWTSQPRAHHGLGVDIYTQVSSPIRRYLDFVIQMQMLHHEKTGHPAYPVERMIEWAQQYETVSAQARKGMRQRATYWIMVWLDKERPDLEGWILRPDRVYFPQFHYQGILQPPVDLPRGHPIRVKVKRAYPRRGLLYVKPNRDLNG